MINLFQPSVGDNEANAVGDVLASGWLGDGPRSRALEGAFAEHAGTSRQHVLTVASCTEGLFQVLAASGLGPGDDVVMPTVSFVGAAHAVRSTGARPVLCDVDRETLNPTVSDVVHAITPATKALVVLHYGGLPGAVADLAELALARGLLLIEDAACGLGSSSRGRPCGTFGDAGVWSFDAAKVITTGDGGMIWCRHDELADRLRGKIRLGVGTSGFTRSKGTGGWWEIDPAAGRRATMNDIAAAIGLVQLPRLGAFLRRRREVASAYDRALADLPWLTLPPPRDAEVAFTFYPVQCDPAVRDRLAVHLLERGVYTNFRYWPLHRMSLYRTDTELPGADHAAASTLLLPVHQGLSDADVTVVVDAVRSLAVPPPSRE